MNPLMLHEFHHSLGARFGELGGAEVVAGYVYVPAEHAALRESAGVVDLSFRSRLCLVGADRARYLHGQVTNDVKKLKPGEGCYAAITTAKGKMESDLNILCLADELLLDFEPGLTEKISQRLDKYIVADDVQIVDAAPHYGLLSVQGPKAEEVVRAIGLFGVPPSGGGGEASPDRVNAELPTMALASVKVSDAMLGEIYLVRNGRIGDAQGKIESPPAVDGARGATRPTSSGFDLFVPNNSLGAVADKLVAAAKAAGGGACGWTAFEMARIEAGIPRYGADMDETNLPLECGIESRAIVYNKGCYIGQEVINRVHSFGHVNKELRGLRLADDLTALPVRGDKLFQAGKEVGQVTSAAKSLAVDGNIALGYVRREANQVGGELVLRTAAGESAVKIVELPFA
ncbi:MAG: glycine cleavage T C-terminal barrel domain-containing protein [Verrucomicrobiae bacterium]|nr:glycine cleavage T C-terminal barrel domain-containing protein [Verrucomicrobiae bacterium]